MWLGRSGHCCQWGANGVSLHQSFLIGSPLRHHHIHNGVEHNKKTRFCEFSVGHVDLDVKSCSSFTALFATSKEGPDLSPKFSEGAKQNRPFPVGCCQLPNPHPHPSLPGSICRARHSFSWFCNTSSRWGKPHFNRR